MTLWKGELMATRKLERLMAVWNRRSISKVKLRAMSTEEILLWASIQCVLSSTLFRNGEGGSESLSGIRKQLSVLRKNDLIAVAAAAIKLHEEARSVLVAVMNFAQPEVAALSANDKHQLGLIREVDRERGRHQSLIASRRAADKSRAAMATAASAESRRKTAEESWQRRCVQRAQEMVKSGVPKRELAGRLAGSFNRTPRTIRDLLKKKEVC